MKTHFVKNLTNISIMLKIKLKCTIITEKDRIIVEKVSVVKKQQQNNTHTKKHKYLPNTNNSHGGVLFSL